MHFIPKSLQIESLDSPDLAPYRTMRRPEEHLHRGIFVAEGEKVVRRLLESNLIIESMLLTPEWHARLFGAEVREKGPAVPVYTAPRDLLENIVGFHLHQGIMAVGRIPDSPPLAGWASALPETALIVALDGLVNSENVGIIVRNAAGFGADGILSAVTSSSPYLRRAVRNSMGGVFSLPVFESGNLPDDLHMLHAVHGFEIIGADPNNREHLAGAEFGNRVCLVLGNEGDGLSPQVLGACTRSISIPMMHGTDSLNVANASAVFLYELTRKRTLRER